MLNVESRSAYSSEHEIFRNSVCKFLDAEYVPYADQWEKDGVISRSFWLACGKAACCALLSLKLMAVWTCPVSVDSLSS